MTERRGLYVVRIGNVCYVDFRLDADSRPMLQPDSMPYGSADSTRSEHHDAPRGGGRFGRQARTMKHPGRLFVYFRF
jgi:hypothetical protein